LKKRRAKKPQKKSVWNTVSGQLGGAAASVSRGLEQAALQVTKGLGPAARKISSTAAKVRKAIDIRSVGGAVAGLTTGEIVGGIVGGAAGMAFGGPLGAATGAQICGIAVGSVGLKLGYDVTYNATHKKTKKGKISVQQRLAGVARSVVKRSGDSVGSGVGALGGAAVGTVVAGPLGGTVGAFVGESLAGDFVENRSLDGFDRILSIPGNVLRKKSPAAKLLKKKQEGAAEALARSGKWASGAMRDAILEGGAEAAFAAVGALAAGPTGARIAGRAGLVAAKRVNWNEALADKPARKRAKKTKSSPRARLPKKKQKARPKR
jgi:hypothetical protein